jgi:hypothetical protein
MIGAVGCTIHMVGITVLRVDCDVRAAQPPRGVFVLRVFLIRSDQSPSQLEQEVCSFF